MVAFSAKKSTFSIPVSRKAEPLPAIIRSGKEFLKLKIPAAEMKTADFISINCNVVPETVGLISREKIALMKPTAYLVNTARAKILDYDALYDALAEKRIAGAGLDVYPVEPIPAGNKFLSLRNVVLTPHLAGSARDIVGHQTNIVLTDVKKILAGEKPRFICNPEVLA